MPENKTIKIFCKKKPQSNREVLQELRNKLQKWGYNVLLDQETSVWVGETSGLENHDIPTQADLIVVLGGDGTLLGVARLVHPYEIPILAVNLGSLGFITEISLHEFDEAFKKAIKGQLKA